MPLHPDPGGNDAPKMSAAGMNFVAAFVALVALHRPDGEIVFVNPKRVVTITSPHELKGQSGLFAPSVHCLVHTSDRKFLSVKETCSEVHKLFKKEG
jgi:hypothetical protein